MQSHGRNRLIDAAAAAVLNRAANASKRAKKQQAKRAAAPASLTRTGGYATRLQGGPDLQFVDTNAIVQANTTGLVVPLNLTATGAGPSDRYGKRIAMKSSELRVSLVADSAANVNVVSISIVLDKQANGNLANITDIYDSAEPYSLRNMSQKRRFWVLWDSGMITMAGTAASGIITDSVTRTIEMYKRLNLTTEYNSNTSAAIGAVATNALLLVIRGSQVAGTGDVTVTYRHRLRFLP